VDDLTYWTVKLKAAERELDAATARTAPNTASPLQLRLGQHEPLRRGVWLTEQNRHECALKRRLELRGNRKG
jgi:hypothetical protein